jgi:hypothetical protein
VHCFPRRAAPSARRLGASPTAAATTWFYGASGNHFPVHSLALVIPGLAKTSHARLLQLQKEIACLPTGQREYVDWVLANALGEHREVFFGPVDR